MRFLILILLFVLAGPAQAAYKCTGLDGKVQYTESPCPAGTTSSEIRIQPNTVDSSRPRAAQQPGSPAPAEAQSTAGANAVCPGPLEVRNLETSAASVTIGKLEQVFLREEVRRARACVTAGNSYTAADWRRIKEGQSAQYNFNPVQRRAERRTVEDIHASASPAERERLRAERAALAGRGPHAITECDDNGCWDSDGARYNRAAGSGRFIREDGTQCRSLAGRMECK